MVSVNKVVKQLIIYDYVRGDAETEKQIRIAKELLRTS